MPNGCAICAFVSLPRCQPDIITLESPADVRMHEDNISWKSDREKRFKQPPGFVSVKVGADDGKCPTLGHTCEECFSGDALSFEGCENYTDEATGSQYKFWYPDNEKVKEKRTQCDAFDSVRLRFREPGRCSCSLRKHSVWFGACVLFFFVWRSKVGETRHMVYNKPGHVVPPPLPALCRLTCDQIVQQTNGWVRCKSNDQWMLGGRDGATPR